MSNISQSSHSLHLNLEILYYYITYLIISLGNLVTGSGTSRLFPKAIGLMDRTFSSGFIELPSELLERILLLLLSPPKSSLQAARRHLLSVSLSCKKLSEIGLPLVYDDWYNEKIEYFLGVSRILDLRFQRRGAWRGIVCAALACLGQNEWDPGVLRLFTIKFELEVETNHDADPPPPQIIKLMKSESQDSTTSSSYTLAAPLIFSSIHSHSNPIYDSLTSLADRDCLSLLQNTQTRCPNPWSPTWSKILNCTMDFHDLFSDGELAGDCSSLIRYSERMDIGSFLLYIPSRHGNILLRCKPIGQGTKSRPHGTNRLVIWDYSHFGFCSVCNKKLDRLQVCADCRVIQYCSRDCQRKDWERGHKEKCPSLAFHPYIDISEESPDGESLQEAIAA
jgi:hypothetical protein